MNLSWITIVWTATASACLTVALVYLGIWLKRSRDPLLLPFPGVATSVAAIAACELMIMRAQTPENLGVVMRWTQVPIFVLVVSLVAYVLLSFRAGSLWLAGGACALRFIALVLSFYFDPNINYVEISGLRQIEMPGGEFVSMAVGTLSRWTVVGQLSSLMLILFLVHAAVVLWHSGSDDAHRRSALVVGSFALAFVIAAGHTALVQTGIINGPYMISVPFLFIVVAMGYKLSADAVQSMELSEQLRASEAELRHNKQRVDTAAAAAQTGIWEWDISRDDIWVTEQGRELFGFTRDERLDLNRFMDKLHPEDREAVRHAITQSLRDGGTYEREYRIVSAPGQMRWIATRGTVEADADGNPVLMRGVSLDISDRKQADAALRESESRFRAMADTAPVLMWMAGTDKLCTYFNRGWLEFTGRTPEQELGNGWAEGVHRDDLDRCLQIYGSAFDARRKFTMEYRLRRADGDYRWILDTGVPRFAPDGTFLGYIGSCLDITERKHSDELLKKERAFLRQVIDVDPNLIFAKNRAGQFTLVNQAVADVFGTTVDNIVGKTDADFSPNVAETEHFRRIDLQVMDTLKEAFVAEEPITTAKGEVKWLQTVKRPILDEDGTANQILGSATDITRRREAEFELALQRNELAHLARVAMLGELSGSLAHELNQPLTAILSNAQAAQRFLARDDVDLNEVREILKDIVNDDKRAGEVISGLRLLLTKGEMQCRPLDLNHVVSDVLRLVRSDLLNGGVIVNTELMRGLPMANGDRVQLQQVLINLVVNACDAMANVEGPARQMVVRTALTAEHHVCVSVSDMGHGIAAYDLERVFEPFFTTKAHGLGLGLAVCRTIISSQGGRLWAANNTGCGASFHFTLPRAI